MQCSERGGHKTFIGKLKTLSFVTCPIHSSPLSTKHTCKTSHTVNSIFLFQFRKKNEYNNLILIDFHVLLFLSFWMVVELSLWTGHGQSDNCTTQIETRWCFFMCYIIVVLASNSAMVGQIRQRYGWIYIETASVWWLSALGIIMSLIRQKLPRGSMHLFFFNLSFYFIEQKHSEYSLFFFLVIIANLLRTPLGHIH